MYGWHIFAFPYTINHRQSLKDRAFLFGRHATSPRPALVGRTWRAPRSLWITRLVRASQQGGGRWKDYDHELEGSRRAGRILDANARLGTTPEPSSVEQPHNDVLRSLAVYRVVGKAMTTWNPDAAKRFAKLLELQIPLRPQLAVFQELRAAVHPGLPQWPWMKMRLLHVLVLVSAGSVLCFATGLALTFGLINGMTAREAQK